MLFFPPAGFGDSRRATLRSRLILAGWRGTRTRTVVTSPKEYRAFALECARQAAATRDDRLRLILLETARLWIQTALHAERSFALSDEGPSVPEPSKPVK